MGEASLQPFSATLSPSLAAHSTGGRGHQVHKSWPISIPDSDGVDPSPSSGEGPALPAEGRAHHGARVMERALGQHLANEMPAPSWLGVTDTAASCLGDFKKFERMSSSGTMSSSEELVDQEGSAGAASAFEQGERGSDPGGRGRGFRLGLWAWS